MIVLVADANIQGHVDRLVKRMNGEPWTDFWGYLQMSYVSFADVGPHPADSDAVVWRRCQDRQLLLLTNNRNADDPDSLESIIRSNVTPASLPVFTIGDADRTLADRAYSDTVIWALYEYLFDLQNLLGTGRLYLPQRPL